MKAETVEKSRELGKLEGGRQPRLVDGRSGDKAVTGVQRRLGMPGERGRDGTDNKRKIKGLTRPKLRVVRK